MLKPQDIVVILKLISLKGENWTQHQIASELCISASEVNASFKRLKQSNLLVHVNNNKLRPNIAALKELLVHGIKYMFPAKLGTITRGIVTSYAAPAFKNKIIIGKEAIPVWPYAEGKSRGISFKPLYPSIPKAISSKKDNQNFYDLLTIVDAIRGGRAREKKIAEKLLYKKLGT